MPTFFEADIKRPESSSPDGIQFSPPQEVGKRAEIITRGSPKKCRRIVAMTEAGEWLCLSCAEPHNLKWVFGMGAYSSERYFSCAKARRDERVKTGICEACNKPVSSFNRRLCERHRVMASARKRRMRERAMHAIRDNLYGHRADIPNDSR